MMTMFRYSRYFRLLGFGIFCLTLAFGLCAPVGADSAEDSYLLTREEQIRVKESQSQELQYKIETLQQQIQRDRKDLQATSEKIWREFSDRQDIERRNLQDQLNSLSQRQAQFESELERKQNLDEIRVREKEAQLQVVMRDSERARKELEMDKKTLEELQTAAKDRKARPQIQPEVPEGTEVLQNGAVQITRASGAALMGQKTLSRPSLQPEYHLSIGDIILIEVWRNPDMTKRVAVRPDGRISLPLAGDLEVAGMDLVTLRNMLTEKFSEYIREPQVTISIEGFGGRKFVILGEVGSPGVYRYQESITLIEAIGLAGGFKREARTGKVMIIRGDIRKDPQVKVISANAANILRKGMISENLAIMPNDILYVGKDFLGDYQSFLDSVVSPSIDTALDFFVLRSAIRTAQEKTS